MLPALQDALSFRHRPRPGTSTMTLVSSPMRHPGDDPPSAPQRREPRDALPPGTLLGDGYRVERTLGQGGFGIVYLATDLTLQRPMAIKEYLPLQLAGRGEGTAIGLREAGHKEPFKRGLQSFLREARMLAQFDHPSLVRVYRFWEENHTAYMAMPYCEGPTLQAARQTMLRPPDEHWLRERLLTPLLGALQLLHSNSCLHRDVSPGNIILKPDGQPVLLDFGSARRVVADMTQPLTAILNPSYAAIEQYAESATLPQGPWTDLYGLAAVVYFAMGGRAPVPATVRAVNEASMTPIAEVAQLTARSFPGLHYSAPFLAAMDKALAVRPADRPQTVDSLREDLRSPHVQPDVTVEGPPLQAVPIKPAGTAGDAPATPADKAPEAKVEDAEAEKAIRAAIDAALADVDDWPPMARERAQRIEPTMGSAPPPAATTPNKATLKVVPGRETSAKATASDKPASSAAEPSKPPASAKAQVPVEPNAWEATAPAVTTMQLQPMPPSAQPVPGGPGLPAQVQATPKPTEPESALPPVALAAEKSPAMRRPAEPMHGLEADTASLTPSVGARPLKDVRPPTRRTTRWLSAAAALALATGGTWYAMQQDRPAEPFASRQAPAAMPSVAIAVRPSPAAASAAPAASAVAATAARPVVVAEASPPRATAASEPSAVLTRPLATAPAASSPVIVEKSEEASGTEEEPAKRTADASTPRVATSGTAAAPRAAVRKSTASAEGSRSTARPKPTATAQRSAAAVPAKASTTDPRSVCGSRTNFSLYYCMRTQCRQARFSGHPQCQRLRENDELP